LHVADDLVVLGRVEKRKEPALERNRRFRQTARGV
jgi:hypothetical protein